jgi:hypothetical protein
MDEESTGGTGFCRKLPGHRRGIHPRKGIPPGITSLFTQIQAGKSKMRGNSRISSSKSYILTMKSFFENLNTKTSLKLKINLIRPY